MPSTPISATSSIASATPTVVYTVPAGRTAVVKTAIVAPIASAIVNATLNKRTTTGVDQIVAGPNEPSGWAATAGYPQVVTRNILAGPITLAAGESVTVGTNTTPAWNIDRATNINSADYQAYTVQYKNSLWCVLAKEFSSGNNVFLYSADGTTWSKSTIGLSIAPFRFFDYGNGYYAVASNNWNDGVWYTNNLSGAWTKATLTSTTPYNLRFVLNRWVVLTPDSNSIFISPAAIPSSFSTFVRPTYASFTDAVTIGSYAVFATTTGILSTTDFTNWSTHGCARGASATNASMSWGSLAFNPTNGDYFKSVGLSWSANNLATREVSVVKSSDGGLNWTPVALPGTYGQYNAELNLYMVNYAATTNHYVIAGYYSNIVSGATSVAYSTDSGATWNSVVKTGLNTNVWNGASGGFTMLSQALQGGYFIATNADNPGSSYFSINQLSGTSFTEIATINSSGSGYQSSGFPVAWGYNSVSGLYYYVNYNNSNAYPQVRYATAANLAAGTMTNAGMISSADSPVPRQVVGRPGSGGYIVLCNSRVLVMTSNTSVTATYSFQANAIFGGGSFINISVAGTASGSKIVVLHSQGGYMVSTDDGATFASSTASSLFPNGSIPDVEYVRNTGLYDSFRNRFTFMLGVYGQMLTSADAVTWNLGSGYCPTPQFATAGSYLFNVSGSAGNGIYTQRYLTTGTFANNYMDTPATFPIANRIACYGGSPFTYPNIVANSTYLIATNVTSQIYRARVDNSTALENLSINSPGYNGAPVYSYTNMTNNVFATDGTNLIQASVRGDSVTYTTSSVSKVAPITQIPGALNVTLGIVEQS